MMSIPGGYSRRPIPDVIFYQEGPGLRKWQWAEAGMKVINVTNILRDGSGTVDTTNTDKYISLLEFEERYKHFAVELDDIVVASSGNTYGKVGRITEENLPVMMNTSVIRFHSHNKDILDDEYLYAFLRSTDFKNQIHQFVIGGAQPNFGPSHIKKMTIPMPSIDLQRRIGRTIANYDRLIANNKRRIQLLEESARLLYKEWFVHLRFPGHEHTPIQDGIPEGWEKKSAIEVMDVLSGGTPKTSNPSYWNGEIPFYTPKDSTDFAYAQDTEKTITDAGLKNCNSKLYPKDTVFITARGTVGKVNLAQRPMAMNQSCYALVAHPPLSQQILYFAMVDGVEQLRSRAVGAVFDAIIRDTFKMIPFVVPDTRLISAFTEHVSPILAQIDTLSTQIRNLRDARDLLLPKLMNGEIQP
ncbi:restriction endonuclease subunit S [bacterium]|nr:restriction endonuclease subunit S [bacterium]